MAFPHVQKEVEFGMGTVPSCGMGVIGSINDLLVCPYDEGHVMAGGRYHSHVEECRKKFGGIALVDQSEPGSMIKCPYNPSHHMLKSVLHKHIMICESFYAVCSDRQKIPPSMLTTYERYKQAETRSTPAETRKTVIDDDESDWGDSSDDDADDGPIHGVEVTDLEGVVHKPSTKKEYFRLQDGIAKELAVQKIEEIKRLKEKARQDNRLGVVKQLGELKFGDIEGILPEFDEAEKLKAVQEYAEQTARMRLAEQGVMLQHPM